MSFVILGSMTVICFAASGYVLGGASSSPDKYATLAASAVLIILGAGLIVLTGSITSTNSIVALASTEKALTREVLHYSDTAKYLPDEALNDNNVTVIEGENQFRLKTRVSGSSVTVDVAGGAVLNVDCQQMSHCPSERDLNDVIGEALKTRLQTNYESMAISSKLRSREANATE